MLKLLKYLQLKDYIFLIFLCGFVAAGAICDLTLPEYMQNIVYHIMKGDGAKAIWQEGFKMLGIAVGSAASTIAVGFCAAKIAMSYSKNTRAAVFDKVNSFSLNEINKFSTPSLITRTTNDITQVQTVTVMFLRMALSAPVVAIWALIKLAKMQLNYTLIVGAAILGVIFLIIIMVIFVLPRFKIIQKKTDKLNGITRENLTGIRVIRANNAEDNQGEKFNAISDSLNNDNLFVNRVASIMMPGMGLIMSGLSLTMMWVGSYFVDADPFFYGNLTVATQYAFQVLMNFIMLTMLIVIVPRGVVSARRINEVLDTKNSIVDGEYNQNENNAVRGKVEFKNVSFKYEDSEQPVLENISFEASIGETVAFIGSTGSGKSTVINLIPRFYDATQGEVLVGGVNVKDYKLHELNEKIGYVPQKSSLFSGTIDSNIKYGKENAASQEVAEALNIAQADDFVNAYEEGVNYELAQRGKNISGGQKQRLQIARAIVKDPEIYIFDDSFSALDYKTDKKLREMLKKKISHATCFIVAQRIGTIMDADKIIVLDNGKIVGQGKHKELLKNCKEYQEIAYSQLRKEELA